MTGGNSHGWPLWRRQITVLAKQEIGRSVFSRRALPVYLLAAMPITLALLRAIFISESERAHATHTTTEFAQVFHFFLLRFIVFFSAALLFVKLFRGEISSKPTVIPSSTAAGSHVKKAVGALTVVYADEVPEGVRTLTIDGKQPGDADYPLVAPAAP